jgi:hypothetical protein
MASIGRIANLAGIYRWVARPSSPATGYPIKTCYFNGILNVTHLIKK